MKKIFNFILGAAFFVAMLSLVSCSADPSEFAYNGLQDTVLSLSTPKVTAKAYPGYNLVSWKPVPDNSGYQIYRYENDNFTDKTIVKKLEGTTTFYEDVDIENGVKYTYQIMALGTIVSRGVVVRDSQLGVSTCTGILPPLDTSALNLAAYEGGYTEGKVKTLSTAEQKKLLTSDKIEAYVDNGKTIAGLGRFACKFMAKAYLNYSILATKGTEYDYSMIPTEDFGDEYSTVINNAYLQINNIDTTSKVGITEAGTYTVYVKASSKNPNLVLPDIVGCSTKIEVPELATLEAPEITALTYDSAYNSVEVTVKVLKYKDGTVVPSRYLKLYEAKQGTKEFKVIPPSEAYKFKLNSSKTAYSVSYNLDPKPTESITYQYMLVVTDGTSYTKKVAYKEMEVTLP